MELFGAYHRYAGRYAVHRSVRAMMWIVIPWAILWAIASIWLIDEGVQQPVLAVIAALFIGPPVMLAIAFYWLVYKLAVLLQR